MGIVESIPSCVETRSECVRIQHPNRATNIMDVGYIAIHYLWSVIKMTLSKDNANYVADNFAIQMW